METKHNKKADLTKLAQIQQLSEEHSSSKHNQIVIIPNKVEPQLSPWKWTLKLNCLVRALRRCLRKPLKNEYNINEEEMTKEVEKIKRRKVKIETLLPSNNKAKLKTLVLDLDQTLIYTTFKKRKSYDFSLQVQVNGNMEKVYVSKRFGLDIFLFQMSQLFELVIFTAGTPEYTDLVLKHIDMQKRISHVLYREHCTVLNGSYFLKNLTHLGRNLKQTLLVDDNSMAGILHPEIFYQIEPFHGDQHDRKLLRLIDFLKLMEKEQDFGCLRERRKQFEASKVRTSAQLKKMSTLEQSSGSSKVCLEADSRIEM